MTTLDLGPQGVAVVGAGLTGSMMACFLSRRGYDVHVFESRHDIRLDTGLAGKSINLILTSRGLAALAELGLEKHMLGITVPVFSRCMHSPQGELVYQAYGPDETHCNFSVSRSQLNKELITAAEGFGATFHFNQPLAHTDIPNAVLYFYVMRGHPTQVKVKARHIFGADGGGSRVRQALSAFLGPKASDVGKPLGAAYKELTMPSRNGKPAIDKKSLHIWPRGTHFLMALPDLEDSFTMTLYMDKTAMDALDTPAKVRSFFQKHYPDSVPLMPDLEKEFLENPSGFLGTVNCSPWLYQDKVVLVGDAGHAIVPFFGQGCNAGFQGAHLLDSLMGKMGKSLNGKLGHHMGQVFEEYYRLHKPAGDAIAEMAVDNYYEMMSRTGDQQFLLAKEVEILLARRYPSYHSRYVLVTHTLIPYNICLEIGETQNRMLARLSKGLKRAEDVDLALADHLIKTEYQPLLRARGLTDKDLQDIPYIYQHPSYVRKAKL